MTKPNYYEILGVSKYASQDEIEYVYQEISSRLHPDRLRTSLAKHMMNQVNEAYVVLSDPAKRANYDKSCITSVAKTIFTSYGKRKSQIKEAFDQFVKYGRLLSKGINGLSEWSQSMTRTHSKNEKQHIHQHSNKKSHQVHVYHHYDESTHETNPIKSRTKNQKPAKNPFQEHDLKNVKKPSNYGFSYDDIFDTDYFDTNTESRKTKHARTGDYGFNMEDVFDL